MAKNAGFQRVPSENATPKICHCEGANAPVAVSDGGVLAILQSPGIIHYLRNSDKRQVAVLFLIIQPVTHHEFFFYNKPHVP